MGRRGDHSREELKTMAIDAAEAIVSETGEKGLTARKVAAKIGYTVGSLYIVFKNLDDLTMHVNGRTLDHLYHELSAVTGEDPLNSIVQLGYAYINFSRENPGRWKMIFEQSISAEDLPEWYYEKIKAVFQLVEQKIALLNPALSADALKLSSRALWSGVHGICILSLTGKLDVTGGVASELTENLIKNYLKGSVL